jgi:phosphopentomutase
MKKFNRIIFVVTDSLGVGQDKRSKEFGDKGASTFFHISEGAELKIPM